jgi:uncharacterized protein
LTIIIRDSNDGDFAALLSLNLESEHFLSPLSQPDLQALHGQAWYCRVACIEDVVQAFLLVLGTGARYASPNYQWFAARYSDFAYVDRVVVGAAARGRRLAVLLYEDLFVKARARGLTRVTCEFDVDPPNEPSRRFHERFGFREVGRQRVAAGKKTVSLQEMTL